MLLSLMLCSLWRMQTYTFDSVVGQTGSQADVFEGAFIDNSPTV